MEGQTATNPQTGEKIVFRGGQWQPMNTPAAPQAPGVIMGRPKAPTQLQLSAEQRAQEDQAFQREKFEVERQKTALDMQKMQRDLAPGADTTEGEKTAGFLATRVAGGLKELQRITAQKPDAAKPTFGVEAVRSVFGDTAANYLSDADRQQVVAAQTDILDAALTLGTGAAYTAEQLKGYRQSYFPQLGDDDATVKAKQQRLVQLLESAKVKAGRSAPMIDEALAAVGASGGRDISALQQAFDSGASLEQIMQMAQDSGTPTPILEDLIAAIKFRDEGGKGATILPPEGSPPSGGGSGLGDFVDALGNVANSITNPAAGAIQRAGETPGFAERILSGATLGLGDEIQGIGGSVGAMFQGRDAQQGYVTGRDDARARNQVADKRTGLAGDVVEIGSSLLVPLSAASTPLRAAASGATAGAIGGFGYGEGAQNSLAGAAIGAGAGAALGYGAGQVGNALANRQAARQISGNQANALLQAGADEGVTVNRAMANPALQPRVTGVSGTMAGSRSIERNMGEIGGQIEGRVTDLGGGGTSLTNEVGGSKVRAVAERQIKKSGEAAKKIYDRAEQASGGVKITPAESLARVDDIAKTLSETPGSNKAELEYLKTLKSDLSKDLSVGGLRRLRTKLRKSISKGDLVFGENEADVLSIMDSASLDIANGLRSQGKAGAAKLFEEADSLYRERAKYIDGTLQKLIGKRNSTMSDQQVFAKFRSLADPKGDGPALERFMSEMSPDEVADVAATFADDLGRNSKKEFSTAFLVSQAEKLKENPTALKAIFGDAGAKSLDNLITLSREHARVTNAARGSQTGVRADYRSWLTNAIFTGGAGLTAGLTQGAGTAALAATATAATVGAAKLGKDALSARLLMSPKVTGWLRSAPKTTNPAAINKHWAKLGAIAKAEPALAAEIDAFRNAVLSAANDNAQRAVAQDRQD